MHPIDRSAGALFRTFRGRLRVFSDGWGDPAAFDLLDITDARPPAPIGVRWGPVSTFDGLRVDGGSFASPVQGLPAPAMTAHVRRIRPATGTDRVCVLLPAWNDEDYRTRTRFAQGLAQRGIASVLLSAAFYGTRRVTQGGSAIRTVADFARMTRTIVEEGRSLVTELSQTGADVGVAGYSMGGSLAAGVAATVEIPLAVAPMAAAHAPDSVFTEGVLRNAVDWGALGSDGPSRLAAQLGRPSVLRLPASPPTANAILVGATADGFVLPDATRAIHRHWPGSELRWVRAGHASLLWWHLDPMIGVIADAFDRTFG